MRFLHGFINRIEPESEPNIDALLRRPDPNDIPKMVKEFIELATIETNQDSDYIEQTADFCKRLSMYVESAGGDPKRVKPRGVGKYLDDLGIAKDEVKPPNRKGKVMALLKRKWNPNFHLFIRTKGGVYIDHQ